MRCYGGKRRANVAGISNVLLVILLGIIAPAAVGMVAPAGSPDRQSLSDQKGDQKTTILIFAPHPDDESLGLRCGNHAGGSLWATYSGRFSHEW